MPKTFRMQWINSRNFVDSPLFWRTLIQTVLVLDVMVIVLSEDVGIQLRKDEEIKGRIEALMQHNQYFEDIEANSTIPTTANFSSTQRFLTGLTTSKYETNLPQKESSHIFDLATFARRQIANMPTRNEMRNIEEKRATKFRRNIDLRRHKEEEEEVSSSSLIAIGHEQPKQRREKHRDVDPVSTVSDRPARDDKDSEAATPYLRGKQHQHQHRLQQLSAATGGAANMISGGNSVFATENNTLVITQIGGTATLPCVVRKFNNGVVSWIRKHDYHLLTVGLTTYNADGRFLVEHIRHLQNWGLLIKHVQNSDEGLYECQVSTHPPTSIFVELKVTEASAVITGAPDLHLRAGSTLRLLCTLRQSTEPPAYVFWYHEHRMINYDHGVNVNRTRGGTGSILVLHEADKSHNGNYTCSPSNAIPASINVHVLNATAEEQPAAMQHANTNSSSGARTLFPKKSNIIIIYSVLLILLASSIIPVINFNDFNQVKATKMCSKYVEDQQQKGKRTKNYKNRDTSSSCPRFKKFTMRWHFCKT